MTEPEIMLWSRLRQLRVSGFHFRRQAPYLGYYLDFVCFRRRLVVELDGSHHRDNEVQAEHDLVRDAILTRHGFVVLRIPNIRVLRNLSGTVNEIVECLERRPLIAPERHQAGA
jgi:very-short-patch-repair endonuclease